MNAPGLLRTASQTSSASFHNARILTPFLRLIYSSGRSVSSIVLTPHPPYNTREIAYGRKIDCQSTWLPKANTSSPRHSAADTIHLQNAHTSQTYLDGTLDNRPNLFSLIDEADIDN